jgi:pre-mRNA-splicing factor CDC5/CEF1
MIPKGTPIRDDLHINEGSEMLGSESAKAEKLRQEEVRRNLRAALGHLPEPTNEYEILVPQLPADEKDEGDDMEMDMADAIALQRKEQEAAELALWKKQSQVIQRALPRPPVAAIQALKSTLSLEDDGKNAYVSSLEHADLSIRQEMIALLENDAAKYPVTEEVLGKDKKKGTAAVSKRPQVDAPALEDFDQEDINQAALLIEDEVKYLKQAMGHEDSTVDDYAEARDGCVEDLVYFPTRENYGLVSVASTNDRLSALQYEFELVKKHMEAETRKAVRLEQKLKVLTHGYQVRAETLWRQIEVTHKETVTLGTEYECFRALHAQEQLAAPRRIENLQDALKEQNDKERMLQLRYENLLVEKENLKGAFRNQVTTEGTKETA